MLQNRPLNCRKLQEETFHDVPFSLSGWLGNVAEDLVDWFCWFVAGCSSKLGFCSNLSVQPCVSEHQ
jgi:hypothetical protein